MDAFFICTMKKILIALFLNILFINLSWAESYYFKKCKLSEQLTGDYIINLDKNIIKSKIARSDGVVQEIIDQIKEVTDAAVFTVAMESKTIKGYYFGYYLDINSKSVVRQRYIQKSENDFILPDGPQNIGYCLDVKADWSKIEEIKQEKLKAEEEKKLKEQKKKQAEKKLEKIKKKETGKIKHNISLENKKWIKMSKYNSSYHKKLTEDFNKRATQLCSSTGNFNILKRKVEIIEIDETPAIGLEPVLKTGISGIIECN